MAWYTIKYADGTYKKQRNSREDNVRYTDDILRSHKFMSIPFLKNALFHDKESLKGACIVCVDTGEIVEYIRAYDNYLLTNANIKIDREKSIILENGICLAKSNIEIYPNNEIGIVSWL
jgi:hypothetical protein